MNCKLLKGSLKVFLLVMLVIFSVNAASASQYLPSTKYVNIQTEFDEMELTLEKFSDVDAIVHCPDFNGLSCPQWDIYNTTHIENRTHVRFNVYDKGAFLGVKEKPLELEDVNISRITDSIEAQANVTITDINWSQMGLNVEFKAPLTGLGLVKFSQSQDSLIRLIGLRNETDLKEVERVQIDSIIVNEEIVEMNTEIIAIEAKEFETAEIKLPKSGPVNTIVKCSDWNFNTSTCLEWSPTTISFTEDSEYIYFNVNSFSAYGGTELTILDVQSYPVTGGYWTFRFTTTGNDTLRIEGINGTEYGVDLEFESLICGDTLVEVEDHGDYISVDNYSCNETGYYKVLVLTGGKHTQKVTFGDLVGYVNNLANNMPNKINVEGKITNSTGSNLNDTYSMTFSLYDDYSAGTKVWWETQGTVDVNEGIFSAILGSVTALNLTWSEPYYLEVLVAGETMSPRINVSSAPYSKSSDRAFNLSCTDCVDEVQIDTTGEFIIDGGLNVTGDVLSMHNNKIVFLGTPTADTDAATKAYVDSEITASGGSASGWNDTGTIVELLTSTDNVNLTTLYVNNTAGKVGIGVESPGEKFHVSGGSILLDNTYSLKIKNAAGTGQEIIDLDGSDVLSVGYDGGSDVYLKSGADIYFRTGGSGTDMFIDDNGEVGIGTVTPLATLEVSDGSKGITFDPTAAAPIINTSNAVDLLITSAGGSVTIQIG
jgi:hypothetical protein